MYTVLLLELTYKPSFLSLTSSHSVPSQDEYVYQMGIWSVGDGGALFETLIQITPSSADDYGRPHPDRMCWTGLVENKIFYMSPLGHVYIIYFCMYHLSEEPPLSGIVFDKRIW